MSEQPQSTRLGANAVPLGIAFLSVFVASIASTLLLAPVTASSGISDVLQSVSADMVRIRIAGIVRLATSVGIVVLAALLYAATGGESRSVRLIALGWWLAEAILLAVSTIGLIALIPLGQEIAGAAGPQAAHIQTLGTFLYQGLYRQADAIHNLFFCLGGVLWYFLLLRSRYIPRFLAIWGLGSVCLVLLNVLLALFNPDIGVVIALGIPYILWEALIGPWLIVSGLRRNR